MLRIAENTALHLQPVLWAERQSHVVGRLVPRCKVLHLVRGRCLTLAWFQSLPSWRCYVNLQRLGEAANPGPPVQWRLHVRNIVSAYTHQAEIEHTPYDSEVWSETSATKTTLDSMRTIARKVKSFLATSSPAGSRMLKDETITGRGHATGSLGFSKNRTKSLHGIWPDVIFQTGRISDALVDVGSFQLRIIGVYGYNSSIPNSIGLNEVLFDEVFRQASACSIPTGIAGDYNFDLAPSPVWHHYSALGFIDVAKQYAALANRIPEPTYRGRSRLDYVVCSPGALKFVDDFQHDSKGYTDHATLTVTFSLPVILPRQLVWHMQTDLASCPAVLAKVSDVPVNESLMSKFQQHVMQGNTNEAFKDFVHAFEHSADQACIASGMGNLPAKYKGRGKGSLKQTWPRKFVVSVDGGTLTDQCCFKARRDVVQKLRELVHGYEKTSMFGAVQRHLWLRICRATCFPRSFMHWLLDSNIVHAVPQKPSLQWFQNTLHDVLHEEKHWSQVVQNRQRRAAKIFRDEDWAAGGRWHASKLKPPRGGYFGILGTKYCLACLAFEDFQAVSCCVPSLIPMLCQTW